MDNIFGVVSRDENQSLWESVFNIAEGRKNLGEDMPVSVYRMFEYAMRDTLTAMFGKDKMVEVFRAAGERTGREFCNRNLDMTLSLNDFIAQLQETLLEFKIGVLRIEQFDQETGNAILTVSEDLDCSGLPMMGETVCNYDEGFIAGILKSYTKKEYIVTEIDCWATGDRVCRFDAKVTAV